MSTTHRQADLQGSAPSSAASTSADYRTVVAVCVGYVMIMMDATVVNTALPAIGRNFSASVSGLQWVVDGYTLIFACLLLSAGSLGDRLRARRVFLLGVGLFVVASLGCGLAPTIAVLDIARVIQGIGAALALPTSLALINAAYPDRAVRAKAIGLWAGSAGTAAGLGPVLGGILTSTVGWRAIFFINIPIGIIGIMLTIRYVDAPQGSARSGLDPLGQLLAIMTTASLTYALIEAGARGWRAIPVVAAFAVAVACGLGFIVTERRNRTPMLPLTLFSSREFSGANMVGAIMNIGYYGELFILSLYLQQVRHLSPLLTGFVLLPQPGIAALAALLGGRHTARFGPRQVMATGLTVGALGLLALTLAGTETPYWVLVAPFLAVGFGTAYTMPAATAAAMEAAPADRRGIASGALNASRQVGSALGVAVFGSLLASMAFMTAFRISVLIAGMVFACGALLAFLAVPARVTADADRNESDHR